MHFGKKHTIRPLWIVAIIENITNKFKTICSQFDLEDQNYIRNENVYTVIRLNIWKWFIQRYHPHMQRLIMQWTQFKHSPACKSNKEWSLNLGKESAIFIDKL